MLKWAMVFFVATLVAALFGFTGIISVASGIASLLFFIFLAIFIVLLILYAFGSKH